TVDNDLPFTDCCPGFGSVAKYVAISTKEAAMDIASMCESSTKVFILEVMGRHAGWIAAAGGLASQIPGEAPHIILFPEVPFDKEVFLARVEATVKEHGYCVIVASEGAQYEDGRFVADAGAKDAFGHTQLGGVAPTLANMVKDALGYKYHWAVADYLQRAARHIASATDVTQAYEMGKAAVEFAVNGKNAVMPIIVRETSSPYKWSVGEAPLSQVANQEKKMPIHYITDDGYGITAECREYLSPLIQGEDYPPYDASGIPIYIKLQNTLVEKKLDSDFEV
ncbi:6-phosphofructokinase, partial [Oleiphilus sp. HI0065]